MREPHVTIILPVYNGEPYLEEALQSVFAQTFSDFELIVLENASTDRTTEILDQIDDARLKIERSEKFLSIEENWGRATKLDLASYLMFLSHDDRLHPDFLKTIVKLIDKHPDATVLTTQFNLIDSAGNILRSSKSTPYIETADQYLLATQKHERDSYGTGYVMRSSRFMEIGGIPQLPNLMFADDLLVYSMLQNSYKVCSPDRQFDYRYHASSTARLTKLTTTLDAGTQYLQYLDQTDYMEDNNQADTAHQYVSSILTRRNRSLILAMLKQKNTSDYNKQVMALRRDVRWQYHGDGIISILEMMLKFPYVIRLGVFRLVRLFSRLTWQIRNHC